MAGQYPPQFSPTKSDCAEYVACVVLSDEEIPYSDRELQSVRAHGKWVYGDGLRDMYIDAIARSISDKNIDMLDLLEWMIDDAWEFERLHNSALTVIERRATVFGDITQILRGVS